ncbi:catalase, partial [Ligilactobacillus salivarius]|nr:catalase [Ligilactobacillus salivarius]
MKDDHQNKQHQSNAQGSEEALSHKTSGKNESEDTLTNRQGHPVTDNQNVRTVGNRGPTTLENYDFLEKISHFDRERIP